jgi:uncharacterized protein (TIGR03083 family)
MSTPAYSELVSAVRREGEGIVSAANLGLKVDIPTCDDWTMAQLVRHMTRLWAYVTMVVSERVTEAPTTRPTIPEGSPTEVLADLLDGLIATLSEASTDTPIWNWSPAPDEGLFWARRMAHEAAVHRFDAQAAHGVVQPVDGELADDGLDELIDVIAPTIYGRPDVSGPTGTVQLQSSDGGAWSIRLTETGIERVDFGTEPDVAVRASSSSLLLASYSRVPWTSLELTGDADLLSRWTSAMNF